MWEQTSARLKASPANIGAGALLGILSAAIPCSWAVNVTAYHYDALRAVAQ